MHKKRGTVNEKSCASWLYGSFEKAAGLSGFCRKSTEIIKRFFIDTEKTM